MIDKEMGIISFIRDFRIYNYKSIKDSGICYLDQITILAGKNESGKSAILEALEDFNFNKSINSKVIPIWDDSLVPEIYVTLKIEKKEFIENFERYFYDSFSRIVNIEIKSSDVYDFDYNKEKYLNIPFVKTFPNKYHIPKEYLLTISRLYKDERRLTFDEKQLKKLVSDINKMIGNLIREDVYHDKIRIYQLISNFSFDFPENFNTKDRKIAEKKIVAAKVTSSNLLFFEVFNKILFDYIIENHLPNFILHKTFLEILPDRITISQARSNPLIMDLAKISNLDFEIIVNPDPSRREKHREQINIKIKKEYKPYWTQDLSNLVLNFDTNHIYFLINEGKEFYKPLLRSDGRQWHICFYIKLLARIFDEKKKILLIDEPGLYLHATAQKDILKLFEKCSKSNQIIYSTHSPYLIPADKMFRVRLVIKKRNRTYMSKVTAKADKDTLSPILTAIGEDLSTGIRTDKKNSVVVEGFSDYLWFMAFQSLLEIDEEINIIPACGAGSVVHVGSILFGWGLDPIFILDNDDAGRSSKKKLIKKLAIDTNRIVMIPQKGRGEIETLFHNEDVNLLGKDKVIAATNFYQKVLNEEIMKDSLNQTTLNNFIEIFEKISFIIENVK